MTKQYPTTSSQLKKLFRKSFRETESPLPQLQIDNQSFSITKHLITLPEYLSSNSVSIFLSMQGEVNTSYILIDLFNRGKSVFIPKCDGKIMKMVELKSMHDFKTLPLNSWGIPEPLDNDIKTRTDSLDLKSGLDLIIMPGMAFDRNGNRIGFGKGYYDYYIQTVNERSYKNGFTKPKTGLYKQLVDNVPFCDTDKKPDMIIIAAQSKTDQLTIIKNE